jgi:hypothetical protein
MELTALLYPTPQMQEAIAEMYAYIIKFLIRALQWYQGSKLLRAVHTIIHPAALRYDDLVKKISHASRNVVDLALMSSHAEQRDMHLELRSLHRMVSQLKECIICRSSFLLVIRGNY